MPTACPRPGETLLGGAFQSFAGGKGANQAVAAARAGGKVAFLGRIGLDIFGTRLRQGLQDNGVDTRPLGRSRRRLGHRAHHERRRQQHDRGGARRQRCRDGRRHREDAFAGIRFVLAQLETPLEGVLKAAQLARAAGAVFILDPAPARALPPELLELVDWLTPNENEACALLGLKDLGEPADMARRLKALGPRGVMLKLGGEGAMVLGADDVPVRIPAHKVEVADTTAAGDAFNGAFAVALSEGKSPPDAARFAAAAAAISVTRHGAQPAMASRTEIDALLNARV